MRTKKRMGGKRGTDGSERWKKVPGERSERRGSDGRGREDDEGEA
jgi:hypothetical protein